MKLILHPTDMPGYYARSGDSAWTIKRRIKARNGQRTYCCQHWRTTERSTDYFITTGSFMDFLEQFKEIAGVLFISLHQEFKGVMVCLDDESADAGDNSTYSETIGVAA